MVGALVIGLAFTFALLVQTATVPRLVPEGDTEAAMAMNSVSYNTGRALAPVLCVAAITAIGIGWAFAFNAISFGVFAATLFITRPRIVRRLDQRTRARDGIRIAWRKPRIILLLAMVAAVTIAKDPVLVLGPPLTRILTSLMFGRVTSSQHSAAGSCWGPCAESSLLRNHLHQMCSTGRQCPSSGSLLR